MKLGFLGIGRIATSVIKGLCTSEIKNITIAVSPRNETSSVALENAFPEVSRMESNQQVLDNSEIVFIALPPASAKNILSELNFRSTHKVVSFIPFLKHEELSELVSPAIEISRAIPLPTVEKHNCPIPVFNADLTILKILESLGEPLPVESETELHTLWTLTGLIAPFYDLCETLSNWTQAKGIKPTTANTYIMDLFWSLSAPLKGKEMPGFGALKEEATTPNGMNEQALKIITEEKAHTAYQKASDVLLERFNKKL